MKSPIFAALLLGLAVGPASAGLTFVDFDRSVDFCRFKTFTWQSGTPAPNPNTEQAITDAVFSQLSRGGLKEAAASGDLSVYTHAQGEDAMVTSVKRFAYGVWQGASVAVGPGKVGMLAIDIVNPATNTLVWRGQAEAVVSRDPAKNQDIIRAVVPRLFKYFPPGSDKCAIPTAPTKAGAAVSGKKAP